MNMDAVDFFSFTSHAMLQTSLEHLEKGLDWLRRQSPLAGNTRNYEKVETCGTLLP